MKKYLILLTVLISSLSFSQIILTKHDGTPITDGQIIAFTSATYPEAELPFYVKNIGTATTTIRVICENLVNADGTNFQFCFGNECLPSVEVGSVYPSTPVVLAPNEMNGNFDHFLNTNTGSGTYPMDYTFRFYQVNSTGNEISNSITMTYRYDPTLLSNEVSQLEKSGVLIKSTVVSNKLELDVLKNVSMKITDLNGKEVMNSNLTYGLQSIDVSNLNTSIYIVTFTDEKGNSTNQKIVKQ